MIRWAEIASQPETIRFETLSRYLNEKGLANEFTAITCEPQELPQKLPEVLEKFEHVRIGAPFGESILEHFTQLPALMVTIRSCDVLVKRASRWWPENLLHEALQNALADEHPQIDLTSAILVVGAGASARSIVAAVLRLGFNRVNITCRSEDKGRAFVEDLKKTFFNTQFQFFPESKLNLLPGIHSVVVNTTPFRPDNELLQQLFYFNFLASPGMVIDCTTFPVETPLTLEAKDVGAHVVSGYRLACYVDAIWAEHHLHFPVSIEDYSAALKAAYVSTVGQEKSRT